MAEILLFSVAVVVIGAVLTAVSGKLGDLDDVPTMRDMVDRS